MALEQTLPRALVAAPAAGALATPMLEMDVSSLILSGDVPLAMRALHALVDVSIAVWTTTARRGVLPFRFDGKPYAGEAGPVHYTCTDGYWVTSVLRALALRRHDAIDTALAFPPELLNAASNLEFDEWRLPFFRALRGVLAGEPDVLGTHIAQGRELAQPAIATVGGPRYARRAHAELDMLDAVVRRDATAFTAAAIRALEAHRAIFGRGRERSHADRFFAFRVTGFAALALDRGLPWQIECDYTPSWLVEGGA